MGEGAGELLEVVEFSDEEVALQVDAGEEASVRAGFDPDDFGGEVETPFVGADLDDEGVADVQFLFEEHAESGDRGVAEFAAEDGRLIAGEDDANSGFGGGARLGASVALSSVVGAVVV